MGRKRIRPRREHDRRWIGRREAKQGKSIVCAFWEFGLLLGVFSGRSRYPFVFGEFYHIGFAFFSMYYVGLEMDKDY
jgi:hypothetical protein